MMIRCDVRSGCRPADLARRNVQSSARQGSPPYPAADWVPNDQAGLVGGGPTTSLIARTGRSPDRPESGLPSSSRAKNTLPACTPGSTTRTAAGLRDFGMNGTRIDDRRVNQVSAVRRNEIRIGEVRFRSSSRTPRSEPVRALLDHRRQADREWNRPAAGNGPPVLGRRVGVAEPVHAVRGRGPGRPGTEPGPRPVPLLSDRGEPGRGVQPGPDGPAPEGRLAGVRGRRREPGPASDPAGPAGPPRRLDGRGLGWGHVAHVQQDYTSVRGRPGLAAPDRGRQPPGGSPVQGERVFLGPRPEFAEAAAGFAARVLAG